MYCKKQEQKTPSYLLKRFLINQRKIKRNNFGNVGNRIPNQIFRSSSSRFELKWVTQTLNYCLFGFELPRLFNTTHFLRKEICSYLKVSFLVANQQLKLCNRFNIDLVLNSSNKSHGRTINLSYTTQRETRYPCFKTSF